MGTPSVGDVVFIHVVADVGRSDFVLCQITSKPYDDSHALSLIYADFSDGGVRRDNFIRIRKLFSANQVLILGIVGHLTSTNLAEVISHMS